MREIKFRAWHQDAKDIVYFGLGANHMKAYSLDDGADYTLDLEHGHPVMQDTGLKDKNGVEIYEGDVVKAEYFTGRVGVFKRIIGVVTYVAPSFVVEGVKQYEGMRKELHGYSDVIGNIYENQELVK